MDEAATPRSEAATASQISDLQDTRRSADGDKKLLVPKALKKLPAENPFKLPPENELFLLRDKEKQEKKNLRELMKHTRIEDKVVAKPRINLKEVAEIEPDPIEEKQSDIVAAVKRDPQFVLAVTRDRRVEREVLSDYIAKKREMFLVQYALNVKRDEMRKLEEIAQAEEKKLELAEQALEEDAAMFDEYLKENDRNSVEAIKAAEAETKAKLEKIGEIKKLNAQIVAIKSEISKHEDTLKEYKMYKSFLDRLTPEAYQQQKAAEKAKRQEEKKKQKEKEKEAAANKARVGLTKQRSNVATKMVSIMPLAVVAGQANRQVLPTWQLLTAAVVSSNEQKKRLSLTQLRKEDSRRMSKSPTMADDRSVTSDKDGEDTESSDDEDLEMYFTSPQQVLDIFAELEEQNLSLIQNSQETEEALEEMRQQIKQTKQKMQKETEVLKEQIEKIKAAIAKEEDRAKELELKTKMFSYGQFDAEQQDALLHQLNQKVTEVYRNCIGGEANIKGDTLQMLAAVEHRLEELCDTIENMPREKVEAAERAKEKQRRLEMREQKLLQQKLHQEERIRKALERAKQPPKKQHGRRPVYRSEPPKMKARDTGEDDRAAREAEELAYYLQP